MFEDREGTLNDYYIHHRVFYPQYALDVVCLQVTVPINVETLNGNLKIGAQSVRSALVADIDTKVRIFLFVSSYKQH